MNAPLLPSRGSAVLLPEELRRRIAADARVKPWIYWMDLLGSAGIGWGAFVGGFLLPFASAGYWALTAVSVVAFLRAAYFVHELVHRTAAELPGFHLAWHVLVGVPILVPDFMMWPHREHHRPATYGTPADPEYAPVPEWRLGRLVGALAIHAIVPALLAARFGFAPLGALHPRSRRHAIAKVSTADIHHEYERPPIPAADRARFLWREAACVAFVWGALALTVVGVLPWWLHAHRWLVMALALILNHARLLVIHRYASGWEPMSGAAQTEDTVTLGPDSALTELVAPVGSRFHALHHELPDVPYHALPAAHRRLMAELPADHPYRATVVSGLLVGWRDLVRARRVV